MNTAPESTYEAVVAIGTTGLVGTLELGLLDNQGATTDALSTTGIIELGTSGVYSATRTAPAVAGQYTLLWSLDGSQDPDQVIVDELHVTFSTLADEPTGPTYATVEELARILRISDANLTLKEDALTRVLVAATGEIDNELGRTAGNELAGWELSLAAEVCLERAVEHWQQMEAPFGVLGLGGEFPTRTSTSSWDRHAAKLVPLKEVWGFA